MSAAAAGGGTPEMIAGGGTPDMIAIEHDSRDRIVRTLVFVLPSAALTLGAALA